LIERADILLPVLDAAAMRAADAFTIEELGIPGFTLMEIAGREAARMAADLLGKEPGNVLVCVGKGNNGGDGLVAARWLLEAGHHVHVLLTAAEENLSEDCRANLAVLTRRQEAGLAPNLVLMDAGTWSIDDVAVLPAQLVIDALFGTGLESALRSPYDDLVRAMNAHTAPILALDIPSGLSATSGQAFDPCISAAATATMGALKAGHLLEDGPDVCGRIGVVDIGIPAGVLRKEASGFLSTDAWVSEDLRPRTRHDHKYSTGPTLIAGGSPAFPGAPVLASRAAARIGSGYVVALGPDTIRSTLQESLDAIPVAGWKTDIPPPEAVTSLQTELDTRWSKARALLIGPGLGRDESTHDLIWSLLDRFDGPVVLDADALFAIQYDRERVAEASGGRWILTPHEGELARLDPKTHANRIKGVRHAASSWNCVVLAKGQPSITAAPDGRVMINGSGHPAAATAGSGDVLAGITAGLLAQGLEPFAAAAAGIHIGGTAAGHFVEQGAAQSLVATDIIDALPNVLRQLV